MKRLLIFISLMFFFSCEKDNPDAISYSNNNGSEDNACAYSYFNVNGSANHDGEYLLSSPNLINGDIISFTDDTGSVLYGVSNLILFFENEGEWSLGFTIYQNEDSTLKFVDGTYSHVSLPFSESSFEEPVSSGYLYLDGNGENDIFIDTIDGVMSVSQEDQNYIITFNFVDDNGVEINGCYSGEIIM